MLKAILALLVLLVVIYKNAAHQESPYLLAAKCTANDQCALLIPNSICALPDGRCRCAAVADSTDNEEQHKGEGCLPIMEMDDDREGEEDKMGEQAVEEELGTGNERQGCSGENNNYSNNNNCYPKRLPGQHCQFTEQCVDMGLVQYQCIANVCQIPPECPPGHVTVGVECLPFAVTGGDCKKPVQCLSGSVCILGRCRGPCEENQLFVDNNCLDYEGGGCIARSCVEHKCPRAFPSCNYIPQKEEYLCCERQIRSFAQCPDPSSVPQINRITNDVVNCMLEQCAPGFTCQFSNYDRGSYICCTAKWPDNIVLGGGEEGKAVGEKKRRRRRKFRKSASRSNLLEFENFFIAQ